MRDPICLLQEVTDRFPPMQFRRSARPLDDPLLSGREVPGARIQYRLKSNILMQYDVPMLQDSGILSTDQYAQRNTLISNETSDLLSSCDIKCPKCGYKVALEHIGEGTEKTLLGQGSNDNCGNSNMPGNHRKLGNKF